jgi:hypothetical protein
MAEKATAPTETEQGSLELTEQLIRERAYRLYEERGCEQGHDLDDWLKAEGEVMWRETRRAATRR